MWVYINTNVVDKLGWAKAVIVEHLFSINPHNNEAKVNISGLTKVLPVSLSTIQRSVKELVEEQYLSNTSKSVYSLSPKFFDTFEDYKFKQFKLDDTKQKF